MMKSKEEVSPPENVIAEVCSTFTIDVIGEPSIKPHGRVAYTISVGFGHCALDLSFLQNNVDEAPAAA